MAAMAVMAAMVMAAMTAMVVKCCDGNRVWKGTEQKVVVVVAVAVVVGHTCMVAWCLLCSPSPHTRVVYQQPKRHFRLVNTCQLISVG